MLAATAPPPSSLHYICGPLPSRIYTSPWTRVKSATARITTAPAAQPQHLHSTVGETTARVPAANLHQMEEEDRTSDAHRSSSTVPRSRTTAPPSSRHHEPKQQFKQPEQKRKPYMAAPVRNNTCNSTNVLHCDGSHSACNCTLELPWTQCFCTVVPRVAPWFHPCNSCIFALPKNVAGEKGAAVIAPCTCGSNNDRGSKP